MRAIGAGAVAACAAVALAGCGASKPHPGAQVADYIRRVNVVESRLRAPFSVVIRDESASTLTGHRTTPADARRQVQTLLGARAQIRAVSAQLATLAAPAQAAHLRRLLLRLVAVESDLTEQIARLTAFLPGFTRALRPLGPATVRLEQVLGINHANGTAAVAAVYAAKAQALRTFATTTAAIERRLRALQPPRALLPEYRTELGALAGMGSASRQMAGAMQSRQTSHLAPLLVAFDRAAAAPGAISLTRAQRKAIQGYDREIAQVNELQVAAARERLRLVNTFG